MIDVQKLAAALGDDDGEIHAITEWKDCHIHVVRGKAVYVNNAFRKAICREDLDRVLRENDPDVSEEEAARELLSMREQIRR